MYRLLRISMRGCVMRLRNLTWCRTVRTSNIIMQRNESWRYIFNWPLWRFIYLFSRLIFIYSEGLLPPNSLECVRNAAPTSRVYASSTGIQMIAENNKLCRYATLQRHNVFTKNREYQWSSLRRDVYGHTSTSVGTWHLCRLNLPSWVEKGVMYTKMVTI
jgi:hypothetical protein